MKKTDGQLFLRELQKNDTIHADCDFPVFFYCGAMTI